jgi:hypothetical protein
LHFVASDDEHLEPKFERPIPPGPNLVTARGLAQLSAKVAEIEGLVASLSEEEALKAARRDLRYWSTRLATAQLMPGLAAMSWNSARRSRWPTMAGNAQSRWWG